MPRCLVAFIYRPRVVCEKSIVIAGRVDESSHQPPRVITSLAAGQGYSQQGGGDLDGYCVISLDFHNLVIQMSGFLLRKVAVKEFPPFTFTINKASGRELDISTQHTRKMKLYCFLTASWHFKFPLASAVLPMLS